MRPVHRGPRQADAPQSRQALRLGARQGQILGIEDRDPPPHPQPRKRGRWQVAAADNHGDTGGQDFHAFQQQILAGAAGRQVMKVVEHPHRGQTGEQRKRFEETAREYRHARQIFLRQRRKTAAQTRIGRVHRKAQVMEQRCRIGITGVELVPDRTRFPVPDVAGNQTCLARARRCGNPYYAARAGLVETPEQRRAVEYLRQARRGHLGRRGSH